MCSLVLCPKELIDEDSASRGALAMSRREDEGRLGVFVIATKNYVDYAKSLIRSASQLVRAGTVVAFKLLTDSPDSGIEAELSAGAVEVSVVAIPSLGWPEATLLRFGLIRGAMGRSAADVLVYMDADMEFVAPFGIRDFTEPFADTDARIALVAHPGYFNRNHLYRALIQTPCGPWETRPQSAAFVPILKRRTYVCGGLYWGETDAFSKMIEDLSHSVETDLSKGLRAKHNDESHLNRWLVEHQGRCTIQPPRWAHDETYRHLRQLSPIVRAIRKPKDFVRIPTEFDVF